MGETDNAANPEQQTLAGSNPSAGTATEENSSGQHSRAVERNIRADNRRDGSGPDKAKRQPNKPAKPRGQNNGAGSGVQPKVRKEPRARTTAQRLVILSTSAVIIGAVFAGLWMGKIYVEPVMDAYMRVAAAVFFGFVLVMLGIFGRDAWHEAELQAANEQRLAKRRSHGRAS